MCQTQEIIYQKPTNLKKYISKLCSVDSKVDKASAFLFGLIFLQSSFIFLQDTR